MKKLFIILSLTLFTVGCGKEETIESTSATSPSKEKQVQVKTFLYENKEKGIRIGEVKDWKFSKEEDSNVVFQNEKLQAIITILPTKQDVKSIKRDLIVGAGDITIIEETDKTLSFHSNRKESIRTDVSISQVGEKMNIVTFVGKVDDDEVNRAKIIEFKKQIQFN
ncbi:hypothetical protein FS935_12090 [Metabacillus litoralis]|uniref:Uncharacterized protein n=1 Tax=Metabacillus litoralis TaxID=152268 RepID=A0A5C6W4A9_9BACI|nr:hypothetical protein [Metabacillus litoralis]TXC90646.1 hypothetical protein FS935_12090 [Metabacillus litoralis]